MTDGGADERTASGKKRCDKKNNLLFSRFASRDATQLTASR
jgi:hypothetical protein